MLGKTISLMGKTGVKSPIPHGEDDDVKAERTRVSCEVQKLTKESAVVMTNLRKCYGDTIAVQNLTLGKIGVFSVFHSLCCLTFHLTCCFLFLVHYVPSLIPPIPTRYSQKPVFRFTGSKRSR